MHYLLVIERLLMKKCMKELINMQELYIKKEYVQVM